MGIDKDQMLKSLPGPLDPVLVPPYEKYSFFDFAEQYPFQAKASAFSPVNNWWLAECSALVYSEEFAIEKMAMKAGFHDFHFFDASIGETFLAVHENFCIVSFRGTEVKRMQGFADLAADFDFFMSEEISGGLVHRGFQSGIDEVWYGKKGLYKRLEEVQSRFPKTGIWFTGHSLGGAMASIAAHRFPTAKGLYTFGSPKVGDEDFVKSFQIPCFRIVNNNDPIPFLPPNAVMSFLNKRVYQHAGEYFRIDKHGKLCGNCREIQEIDESVKTAFKNLVQDVQKKEKISFDKWKDAENIKEFLSLAKKTVSDYLPGDMTDHAPLYYALHAWNQMIGSL